MKRILLLVLCALFAGCATQNAFQSMEPPVFIETKGIPMVVQVITRDEALVITQPERACSNKSFGTLLYTNARTGEKLSTVWSQAVPVPPNWPQAYAAVGITMCQWYKRK